MIFSLGTTSQEVLYIVLHVINIVGECFPTLWTLLKEDCAVAGMI